MEKFGKPSAPLLDARGHLLTPADNDPLVERMQKIYEVYRNQPRRLGCKICSEPLGGEPVLRKFEISYHLCKRCGHLNGSFQDTAEFNGFLNTGDASGGVAADYREASRETYLQRVDDIYVPKQEFLFEALKADGAAPNRLRYADLGSGSGYFVAALKQAGIAAPHGYDVSESQIEFGNRMLGESLLRLHAMDELEGLAARVEADVVSLIFTLEHLEHPQRLLAALQQNATVRYVLIAVPTVAPTMFFELAFPTVFERHLSTHTHVFSDKSLRWLAEATGFSRIGEWWFGSDAMDIYRDVAVRMRQVGQAEAALDLWTQMMRSLIDEWQLAIDRRKLSSAVHLVLRKRTAV